MTAVAIRGGGPEAGRRAALVRNRYIDVLRAVALFRVITFHLFGWDLLPLVFPSMGLMFAFGGLLMASSLDRSAGGPLPVLLRRLRRLLPPLWALGLVLVPIMLLSGWTTDEDFAQPAGLRLLSWIVPITEPPGSDLAYEMTLPLWYLRTYLWLMLLSPLLLWLWRRAATVMMVLPLVGVLLESLGVFSLVGPVGDGALSTLIFAACWMLGFAHHDGKLQKVAFPVVLAVGLLLCGAALAWAFSHPISDGRLPLVSDIPLAQTLYSLGFAMVLLRLPVTFSGVDRVPFIRGLVDVINRRAMTIYLWHSVAIFLAQSTLEYYGWAELLEYTTWDPFVQLGGTLLVLFGIILVVGWVEDIAARRRPRLLPVGPSPDPRRAGRVKR